MTNSIYNNAGMPSEQKSSELIDKPQRFNTYRVDMTCINCGHHGHLFIPKGQERTRVATCPICECQTYKSGL